MTAREYLSQAYNLDRRIENRLEQLASLRQLATKTTNILKSDRVSTTRVTTGFQETIARMIDMEEEINAEIDRLVDLKAELRQVICSVPDPEAQMLLELRYLCFKPWKEIAEAMNYHVRHIYRIHDRALEMIRMHEQRQERADLFGWKGPGRADQDVTKSSSGQNSRRELSFTEEEQT